MSSGDWIGLIFALATLGLHDHRRGLAADVSHQRPHACALRQADAGRAGAPPRHPEADFVRTGPPRSPDGSRVLLRGEGAAELGCQPERQSWIPAAPAGDDLPAERYWLGIWNDSFHELPAPLKAVFLPVQDVHARIPFDDFVRNRSAPSTSILSSQSFCFGSQT